MPNRHRCTALGAALIGAALLAGCAQDPVTETVHASEAGRPQPAEMATMMRLAQATMDNGAYASAAGFYRRAHDMNPHAYAPLLGLGKALARIGADEDAAAALRKAVKKQPGDPEARRLLGEVLIALNRPTLAIAEFDKALKLKPDARAYNGLGVANDMTGAYEAAQKAYRAGLDLEPASPALNNNFALSLAVTGHYREAIRRLEPLVHGPFATARQRHNLALVYGLAGERDKAARLAGEDLDHVSVEKNLAFYESLRHLRDPNAVAAALGLSHADPEEGAARLSAR